MKEDASDDSFMGQVSGGGKCYKFPVVRAAGGVE